MFSRILELALGWMSRHQAIATPLFFGLAAYVTTAIGPRVTRYTLAPALALISLWLVGRDLVHATSPRIEGFLFIVFGGLAVASAFLMITQRDPVYAALWFALVILNTCGLFLLQAAPFLAAASITVYAGAIIVTFLFVIMLAQQTELAPFNQHFRHPIGAGLAALLFLTSILGSIEAPAPPGAPTAVTGSTLSRPAGEKVGGVTDLGRSLFTDYLWGVELAGTLLLVATIGTIVIANRPREAAP